MCYNDRPSITPYPFAQSPIDRKHFFSLHFVLFNLTNNVSTPRHRYYRITQRSLIYQKLYADLRCIRIIRVAHCNVALPLLSIGGMVLINISIVINVDTIISTITSGERVFMYKHWIMLYKEAVSLERKKNTYRQTRQANRKVHNAQPQAKCVALISCQRPCLRVRGRLSVYLSGHHRKHPCQLQTYPTHIYIPNRWSSALRPFFN